MEPTNDETAIRKVLAEFMGWDDFWEADQGGRHWLMGMAPDHQGYYAYENDRTELPDYTNDLNEMWAVEMELEHRGLRDHYTPALMLQVGRHERDKVYITNWRLLHATAEQRARAAYAVIKALQQEERAGRG